MEAGIDQIIGRNPDLVFAIIGCFRPFAGPTAQKWEQIGDRLCFIDPFNLDSLNEVFFHTVPVQNFSSNNLAVFTAYQPAITDADHFVHIATGCSFHCSYCNIKISKGEVQSRPANTILDDVEGLWNQGVREVVLLGDDCGSYGLDIESSLALLIRGLLDKHPELKVKIYNAHPTMFVKLWPQLREFFISGSISYLCLPLQSGVPRILKMMGRHDDLDRIRELLQEIRSCSPGTHLFSHFILNFPTETLPDFEASMKFARQFAACLFIPFGSNVRTEASKFEPQGTSEDLDIKRGIIADMICRKEVAGLLL